jgi:hypothetical protein
MEVEYSQAFVDKAANLSYQEVSAVFHLPLYEACAHLRVDESSLKKRCRQLNIPRFVLYFIFLNIIRWPYRKRYDDLIKQIDDAKQVACSQKSSKMFHCFSLLKNKAPTLDQQNNSNTKQQDSSPLLTPNSSHCRNHFRQEQGLHDHSQPPTPTTPGFNSNYPHRSHHQQSNLLSSPHQYSPSHMLPRSQEPGSPFSVRQPSYYDVHHEPTFSEAMHYVHCPSRTSDYYRQQQTQRQASPHQQQQNMLPSVHDLLARIGEVEDYYSPKQQQSPFAKPPINLGPISTRSLSLEG